MPAFAQAPATKPHRLSSSFIPSISRRHVPHPSYPMRCHRRHAPITCVETKPPTSRHPPSSSTKFNPSTSALLEGIRAVAVGKLGSKPVPLRIFPGLFAELSLAAQSPATEEWLDLHLLRASFLGSLFVKAELSAKERELLSFAAHGRKDGVYTAEEILAAADAGGFAKGSLLEEYAMRVLKGERLSVKEGEQLGGLLYGVNDGVVGCRGVKALIGHVMRVRHESEEELCGLALAAKGSLNKDWFDGVGQGCGRRFALVAEPYDGAVKCDLLTPLLCKRLKEYGFSPVMGVGKSCGPKYGPNLRDVARALEVPFCVNGKEVGEMDGVFGVAVDQKDCSEGLDEWVRIRRTIVKRPSIATTEKFVDVCPGGASLFVGSAFHGSYVGKMAACAEMVGFEAYIIVGKGVEGSTGLGVGERRTATLVTGWRKKGGGGYGREEVLFNVVKDGMGVGGGGEVGKGDEIVSAESSARKMLRFVGEGTSGDGVFDRRVEATMRAFDKAVEVIAREREDVVVGG